MVKYFELNRPYNFEFEKLKTEKTRNFAPGDNERCTIPRPPKPKGQL